MFWRGQVFTRVAEVAKRRDVEIVAAFECVPRRAANPAPLTDCSQQRRRALPIAAAAICRSRERHVMPIFVLAWRVGAYRIEPILSAGGPQPMIPVGAFLASGHKVISDR